MEGLSGAGGRPRHSAVPLARGGSVPRAGAARWRDVGARPGAARHRRRHRPRRGRVGLGPDAAHQRSRRLLGAALDLKPGQEIAPIDLAELLVDAGFTREDPADEHGEFAVRGGIVDIFPAGESQPVRLEFVGDTIESMRRYDAATQRSVESIDQISIVPLQDVLRRVSASDTRAVEPGSATIFDYLSLRNASRILVSERDEVDAAAAKLARAAPAELRGRVSARKERPLAPADLFAELGGCRGAPRSSDTAGRARAGRRCRRLGAAAHRSPAPGAPRATTCGVSRRSRCTGGSPTGSPISAASATPARRRCSSRRLPAAPNESSSCSRNTKSWRFPSTAPTTRGTPRCSWPREPCRAGFRLPAAGLQIYAEADVFEEERRAPERRRSATKAFLSDLRDLKVNDLVVHVDHGIGMFVGLKQIGVTGDAVQEFLELRYAGEDKLFVPVERLDLVQKYTGASRPPLDRLGGTSWERAKTRVKKAMRDMAEELLKLYAARKAVPGHAFSADSHWQQEFEDAFEYELTPDQKTAIADIKRDMESPTPMDRLLCGDVGYGKTEVAMRARLQGGHGRQTGRVSRADDGARLSASEDAAGTVRRLSRSASRW